MFSELKNNFNGFSMIDVHQDATLSESFEGERSRVIGNRCNFLCPRDNYFKQRFVSTTKAESQLTFIVSRELLKQRRRQRQRNVA